MAESHVAILRALRGIWSEERVLVIGATAIACHIGLSWRGTADLDLSIAVGLDDCARLAFGKGFESGARARPRRSPR